MQKRYASSVIVRSKRIPSKKYDLKVERKRTTDRPKHTADRYM